MVDVRGAAHNGVGQPRAARMNSIAQGMTADGSAFHADYLHALAREGRIFVARDGDEDDTVTGQTSFAATTPTFLLDVPNGTVAIPLWVRLVQVGSVAGGAISVHISADNLSRYSSGGTSETISSTRTDTGTALSTLYSGATAAAATARNIIVDHAVIAPDVAPASADAQKFDYLWTPHSSAPLYVVGLGAFLVFTYAASTGPTWRWSVGWAEIPESELNG